MDPQARRPSAISLRRGSIMPSQSCMNLRRSSKSPSVRQGDGVSLASKAASAKGVYRFLSGETISGIKYAVAWTVYLLIGSWLFLVFERTVKTQTVDSEHWVRYKELARTTDPSVHDELRLLQRLLGGLCPHPALQPAGNHGNHTIHLGHKGPVTQLTALQIAEMEQQCSDALKIIQTVTVESGLSFVDSIYYTMTLVTTIGYGHIYPTTRIGRLFAVLFAMVGVPLTCILMAKNSNILSIKMLQVYKNLKRRYGRGSRSKLLLYLVTWLYLSIGFIVFMFIPSVGFVYMESWTYDESLYYTFITLSTIGFGEMVGAYGNEGPYSDLYKIIIVVWIMIALGYWVMLLNFLQKALQTKLVPKRIRVQFKAKQLAKQAEFLRQLMTKVREQWSDEPLDDGGDLVGNIGDDHRNSITLVAEALSHDAAAKGTRKLSLLPPRSRRPSLISRPSISVNDPTSPTSPSSPSCSDSSSSSSERHLISVADDSTERSYLTSVYETSDQATDDEPVHPSLSPITCAGLMTLADLLEADVVVRTPKVPIIRSLMEESTPKVSTHLTVPGEPPMANGALPGSDGPKPTTMDEKQQAKFSKEVTLPLKDVLGLVTLVANLEGQVDGNPVVPDTSIHSTIHSMVSMDAKLPLLREAFLKMRNRRPSHNEAGAKYKAVSGDEPRKLSVPGGSSNNNRLFQRRGSCLDAFLDDQTKREYVEVGKEEDDKTETMSDEMETEEVDVDVMDDDDDDDTFNAPDIIFSMEDDEAEDIEDFLEADDGSRQAVDHYQLSRKGSGGNAV